MADFAIDVRSPDGQNRIAYLDGFGFSELDYVINRNAPGAATLRVPTRTFPASAMREDVRLYIYRRGNLANSATLEGDTCFFVREITRDRDTVTLMADSALSLLSRRIVNYTAGSSQARKNLTADNMMREVLVENFGTSATGAGRAISGALFDIPNAVTGSTYPTLRKSFAWDNVLDLFQDIAAACAELGTYITFDIVQIQGAMLGFRSWPGSRGGDRRAKGASAFVLSVDNGTLTDATISLSWREAKNAVIVGGQGEGSDRVLSDVADADRVQESVFGRNEVFLQSSQQEYTAAELAKEGQSKLNELRPRLKITGKIAETSSFGYGRDYGIDTLMTASVYGYIQDVRVESIHVTLSGGEESIDVSMSNESTL